MAKDSSPLRLVHERSDIHPYVSFCGHCGLPPSVAPDEEGARICAHCGLGLVLATRSDSAPGPEEPFFVVDAALRLSAVSLEAEAVIQCSEPAAVGNFLGQFLTPAEIGTPLSENFFALVRRAARHRTPPRQAVVSLASGDGDLYRARIGSCGPPRAALVVLLPAA
jgi:hypothetical protein